MMRRKFVMSAMLVVLVAAAATLAQAQVVALRAGKMFDPKSGTNLTNQIVLINGDKIMDVGSANTLKIPVGAKVIDLSQATVLPGLIDGHVHLTDSAGNYQHQMMVGLNSATRSLNAGFTTLVVMGSHGGGYADVELRNAIDSGLVPGPRLLPAGPVIEITGPANAAFPLEFKPFEANRVANGTDGMR